MSNYNKYGINKNTYDLLFKEEDIALTDQCSKEIFTVEMSSMYDRNILKCYFTFAYKLAHMCYYNINYFHIHKKIFGRGYRYKDKNIKFDFMYLEHYLRRILKNEDKYVRKEMISDMKHNFRYGSCFHTSMIIASNLENSNLITGLLLLKDNKKCLHSYVEYNGYVIDYTKNLIMKKENYENLLKIQELSVIKSEEINSIYNLLVENEVLNNTKYIVTFGQEITRDLEKNMSLIKKTISDKSGKADYSLFYQF